jgi:uracil-DNA glycosylase
MPPRRECAALWLDHLLAKLPRITLTLLLGQYAQHHFLASRRKPSLAGLFAISRISTNVGGSISTSAGS